MATKRTFPAFDIPVTEREQYRKQIQGSLIGGAVGDALGYQVEFMDWKHIQEQYGPGGIQEYRPSIQTGEAIISDDTQMTLYTANGLLLSDTQSRLHGIPANPINYIKLSYLDWYDAQYDSKCIRHGKYSWLNDIPEMHAWRAPGNTCLAALGSGGKGSVAQPCNSSKGCGGVMRVAPVGLYYPYRDEKFRCEVDWLGAEAAAITHGHPLGYLPAAMMTHIINIGLYGNCPRGQTLLDAVEDSLDAIRAIFPNEEAALDSMEAMTRKAIQLAAAGGDDEANIRALGQGWVGDEALVIALYACLRYPQDFSKAIIASVNHSGDSDSTGAITGNILGAWLGIDAIDEKWLTNLEAKAVILELADDLCCGCQMTEDGSFPDPSWAHKYCKCRQSG